MRRDDEVLCRQMMGPSDEPPRPGAPVPVQREPIPTFVDPLDCLLALWTAEATLEDEGGAGPRIPEPRGREVAPPGAETRPLPCLGEETRRKAA